MDFNRLFPDKREEGETTLRQTQLVMLRMLKIFDFLCEKHGIQYFLIGGSLIGAVRHKGFIPWDDDLDVGMTRENYNFFVRKVVPELPQDIFFQSPESESAYPNCDYVDARLRDKYSSYVHGEGEANNWHEGFQVDIFIYDRAFLPSKFLIILQNIVVNRLSATSASRGRILNRIGRLFPVNFVYANNWQQRLGMMKRKIGPTYLTNEEVNSLVKVQFEDTETYIPTLFDRFLTRQFGDYMKLPPVEKRVSDHDVTLEPFKPCHHQEVLYWSSRPKN